jgi:isoamylase
MLLAGDERGRTQQGNNNAYCQDNQLSWFDWRLDDDQRALLAFAKKVIWLRRNHPVFRRATFFKGRPLRGAKVSDILWLRHDGQAMSDEDWANPGTRSLGVFLSGEGLEDVDADGRTARDDDMLLLIDSNGDDLDFTLPFAEDPRPWELVLDSANDEASEQRKGGEQSRLAGGSLKLFARRRRA